MKNPYIQLVKITWKYAGHRRKKYLLAYFLFILASLTLLLTPFVLALLINHLQTNGLDQLGKSFLLIGIGFLGIDILFWVFHGTARIMERHTSYYVIKNFKSDIYQKLLKLPLKWHKNHHSGDTMSRIEKASQALKNFSDGGFRYHSVIIKFFGSLIALFIIDQTAGLIAVAFAICNLALIFSFDKILIKYLKDINDKWHLFDATFYDYVGNIRTIITLRLEKLSHNQTFQKFTNILPIWRKQNRLNELKWFILNMLISLMFVIVCVLYLYQQSLLPQAFLIGTFVALYEYVHEFTEVFFDFAWKYEDIVKYDTDIKSIKHIFKDSEKLINNIKNPKTTKNWQTIQIKSLNFRYEDEKHLTHNLKNINLICKKGQRIAFIGASGSGKSTLMSLLRGLETPDQGILQIDQKTYPNFTPLFNQATLIPQTPEIFENTIKHNITAGIPCKNTEIEKILKLSRFQQVLKRLPSGLKTNIKEKGVNLSGGEIQRLALARGIFAAKNSQLILLDEPTSSVDPSNEAKIYQNLFKEFKDKCLISSIHRLHLLPKFDYIYLFKKGQIIAQGNFKQLLTENKAFKKMWEGYDNNAK